MKRIIFILILTIFLQSNLKANIIEDLKEDKKISYLDFILLKIENKLLQRHWVLGAQPMAMRVQYQKVSSQIEYIEKDSKIIISIIGVMDKKRYSKKKYRPKVSDCNILRNLLLYGKYGYNVFFQKRNKYLTVSDMKEIFISRFLNNLSISESEKNNLLNNILVRAKIIDPVRGNDYFCSGKATDSELK